MELNTENMSSYSLVFSEEDHQPVIENDKILLWNSTNNSCEYVTLTPTIKKHFNLVDADLAEEAPQENTVFENAESPHEGQEKFTWTHQSTLLMLDAYKTRFLKFRDPKTKKKKTLWDEIALEMRKKCYFVDADLLDRKMRNMKNTYRTILDNNNKKKSTGRGRIQWEYYNYFTDMFQQDKTVNLPKSILSSTKINSKMSTELEDKASCSSNSSSSNIVSTPLSSPSTSSVGQLSGSEDTPSVASSQKSAQASRLDRFRKRQLEVEEEKLKELKKIRESIEESNRIQNEKINLLKQCFLPKETE